MRGAANRPSNSSAQAMFPGCAEGSLPTETSQFWIASSKSAGLSVPAASEFSGTTDSDVSYRLILPVHFDLESAGT